MQELMPIFELAQTEMEAEEETQFYARVTGGSKQDPLGLNML
jgi:hypothetical protein